MAQPKGDSLGVLALDDVLGLLDAPRRHPQAGSAAALSAAIASSLVVTAWPDGETVAGCASTLRTPMITHAEPEEWLPLRDRYRWSSQIATRNERYNEHPDHVRFVQERWLSEVSEFLELDYSAR